MTAKQSEECRKTSVDVVRENPKKIMRMVVTVRPAFQKSLQDWLPRAANLSLKQSSIDFLSMPMNINWKALQEVYESQPSDYEELLGYRGIGPATVRGLALIAELIYGDKPSWKDPVKYSFAYGGKDGVPYPANRRAMDESIQMLRQAIQEAKMGDKEKMRSLERLRQFVPPDSLR